MHGTTIYRHRIVCSLSYNCVIQVLKNKDDNSASKRKLVYNDVTSTRRKFVNRKQHDMRNNMVSVRGRGADKKKKKTFMKQNLVFSKEHNFKESSSSNNNNNDNNNNNLYLKSLLKRK